MKFTEPGIEHLERMLDKMERFYAYKYEVEKAAIAFVIKGKCIHVLVNGKVKEATTPKGLAVLGIHEETGRVKDWLPDFKEP